MRFLVSRTSDSATAKPISEFVELNTLEELIDMQRKQGRELVIGSIKRPDEIVPYIEIYDAFRE